MRGTTHIPVVTVLVRQKGKILAVLRENTDWMNGYYVMPGGHVEYGESFRQAAIRELAEETGLRITNEQLLHRLTLQEFNAENEDQRTNLSFEAIEWAGEPHNAEPDVHSEIAWLDPDNLPKNITPQFRLIVENIQQGNTYTEFGWTNS